MRIWFLQIFFINCVNILLVRAQIGSSCKTYNREEGTCIYIRTCGPIWKIMTEAPRPLPDRIVEYIRGSQCGNALDKTICCRNQDINAGSTTTALPNIYRDHETSETFRRTTTTTTSRPFNVYDESDQRGVNYNNDRVTTSTTVRNVYRDQNVRGYSDTFGVNNYGNSENNGYGFDSTTSTRRLTTTTRRTTGRDRVTQPTARPVVNNNGYEEGFYIVNTNINNQYNNTSVNRGTTRRTTTTQRPVYDYNRENERNPYPSNNNNNYNYDTGYNTPTTSRNPYGYTTESSIYGNNNNARDKNIATNIIPNGNSGNPTITFDDQPNRNRQDRGYDVTTSVINSGSERNVNNLHGGDDLVGGKRETNDASNSVRDITEHRNLNLFNLRTCGPIPMDRPRIANGNQTDLFEFPWMALLGYETSIGDIEFKCGGTLISSRFVLTAAHCVTSLPRGNRLTTVRLGEHDVDRVIDCEYAYDERVCMPEVQDVGIQTIIFHSEFNKPKYAHDIALIKLRDAADFTHGRIRTICLPVTLKLLGTVPIKYVVTGWGNTETGAKSNILLKAALPSFPKDRCADVYGTMTRGVTLGDGQICAGGEGNTDSCGGDSGGPIQAVESFGSQGSRYVQFGIVSFGPNACGSSGNRPAVYTDVRYYMKWILDHMS